jgi:hypothetical protein
MFTFDEDNEESLNPFFDQLGYSQISLIRNVGSAFLFLLIELTIIIIVLPIIMILRMKKLQVWL